jgi:hypothetical protein
MKERIMKYTARVTQVLQTGIHRVWTGRDGERDQFESLPAPQCVEIELDGSHEESCMMYRYRDDGRFCGDTWHENLEAAFRQAEYEYGLIMTDWHAET